MDIGIKSRPKPGETACGDQALVIEDGATIVAVADGLGHGPKAMEAAVAALESIRNSHDQGVSSLGEMIRRCDRAITHTRGVALTLLRFDPEAREVAHAGIGNVEMQAVSQSSIRPPNLPGVVGVRVRRVNETRHDLHPGDLLAVYTDGVSGRFQLERSRDLPTAREIAESIVSEHGKDHDDATCVVIRYA